MVRKAQIFSDHMMTVSSSQCPSWGEHRSLQQSYLWSLLPGGTHWDHIGFREASSSERPLVHSFSTTVSHASYRFLSLSRNSRANIQEAYIFCMLHSRMLLLLWPIWIFRFLAILYSFEIILVTIPVRSITAVTVIRMGPQTWFQVPETVKNIGGYLGPFYDA